MYATLRRFHDPAATAALAGMLCDLITDIRRILIHPDLQNHVKLACIAEAVDELAPPPDPLVIPMIPVAAGPAMANFLLPEPPDTSTPKGRA